MGEDYFNFDIDNEYFSVENISITKLDKELCDIK